MINFTGLVEVPTFSEMVVVAIFIILPAWIANGTPVIFGGGTPLDFNKKFLGKPIFGTHKTIKGTASGILGGLITTALLNFFFSYPLEVGVVLTFGAIVGDLFGSFIKRRMRIKEGASVPIMDQYLFLLFALIFVLPLVGLNSAIFDPIEIIIIVVLTGVLHVLTNILAHKAKLKRVPW